MSVDDFCAKFPLGSKTQVVATDSGGRYAGIIIVAEAHGLEKLEAINLRNLLHYRYVTLLPFMNVQEVAAAFDSAEAESLAVIDSVEDARVVGILTEAYTLRRYAEESERRRRELLGDL
jgi:CIC family chloride channel protein